jgi:hypothetical protein
MTTAADDAELEGPAQIAARLRARAERREVAVAVALVLLAVALAVPELRRLTLPRMEVVGPGNTPLAASFEVFSYDRSPSAPSPTPLLGTCRADDHGRVRLDFEFPPGGVVARVWAPGHGIGYGFVDGHGFTQRIELAPARRVGGSVSARDGQPIVGARIAVFGGGPRGVLLAETTSNADGNFTVDCISAKVSAWTVRAFAEGFAVREEVWEHDSEEGPSLVLDRTAPLRGTVVATEGLSLDGLELRVLNLPGVSARVGGDGRFQLDHLPPRPSIAYPVVAGLGEGWTCERVALVAGGEVEIRIVREARVQGRVVDGLTGLPVAGARVFHEHGPDCVTATLSDASGAFELGRVPPGRIEVWAVHERRRVIPGMPATQSGLAQAVATVEVLASGARAALELRLQ